MLFGCVSHVVTLADGLAVLWRAGTKEDSRYVAVMPIIRQVIEFGIHAIWIERFPDDAESVVREGARQRVNAMKEAVTLGVLAEDATAVNAGQALLDAVHADFDAHFETVCDSIAGGDSTYLHDRIASYYVHPSTYQTDLHLEEMDASSGIHFLTNPSMPSADAWLGMATRFLVYACLAWERLVRTKVHNAQLKAYARELQINARRPAMTDLVFRKSQASARARRARLKQARARQA